jgi:hypothetical protein
VAVEKLFSTKFAKIKLRQEALQSIFSGRLDIFYPPNFGCWGRKASFSTATGFIANNLFVLLGIVDSPTSISGREVGVILNRSEEPIIRRIKWV